MSNHGNSYMMEVAISATYFFLSSCFVCAGIFASTYFALFSLPPYLFSLYTFSNRFAHPKQFGWTVDNVERTTARKRCSKHLQSKEIVEYKQLVEFSCVFFFVLVVPLFFVWFSLCFIQRSIQRVRLICFLPHTIRNIVCNLKL